MFYIMNASCLFDNKAAKLIEAKDAWSDNITVLVCRRETSSGTSKVFVVGSAGSYNVHAGSSVPYTQDTGMGHSNIGKTLYVDNVVHIRDGKIASHENQIGLDEKRRMWTMK